MERVWQRSLRSDLKLNSLKYAVLNYDFLYLTAYSRERYVCLYRILPLVRYQNTSLTFAVSHCSNFVILGTVCHK